MIVALRPQTDTQSVVEPEATFLDFFCGTFSPSRRKIRLTHFRFTT